MTDTPDSPTGNAADSHAGRKLGATWLIALAVVNGVVSLFILPALLFSVFLLILAGILRWGLPPGSARLRATLAIAVALFAIIANMLIGPSIHAASYHRPRALRVECLNHLKQIGMGLAVYASENDDRLPPDLQTLVDADMFAAKVLTCRAARESGTPEAAYVYLGTGRSFEQADAATIIVAHDRAPYHDGVAISLLFLDGHVACIDATSIAELVAANPHWRLAGDLPLGDPSPTRDSEPAAAVPAAIPDVLSD